MVFPKSPHHVAASFIVLQGAHLYLFVDHKFPLLWSIFLSAASSAAILEV